MCKLKITFKISKFSSTQKSYIFIEGWVFLLEFSSVESHNNVTFILPDVIDRNDAHFRKSVAVGTLFWNSWSYSHWSPMIGKRHSHSACIFENSMYVFGGCTATSTAFNDLWKLDLDTREWIRPITMGNYPSPKAYASMVCYKKNFILFGGWSQPSSYSLYQVSL